jgi:acetyltransferase-like isoleucine patch superfamily enzyme
MAGDDVVIGEGAVIGANVVLYDGTVLEPGCEIDHGAVIGKPPRLGPHSACPKDIPRAVLIGAGAAVGCSAVVCAGARIGPGAVVADGALIREGAIIGAESVIGHASSVGRGAVIGERVRIMSKCGISSAPRIEDVFIASLAVTVDDPTGGRRVGEGEVLLRRGCRIGAAAVILPGVEIGEDALVGAGAVVSRSVPPGMLVRGQPARVTGEAPR